MIKRASGEQKINAEKGCSGNQVQPANRVQRAFMGLSISLSLAN